MREGRDCGGRSLSFMGGSCLIFDVTLSAHRPDAYRLRGDFMTFHEQLLDQRDTCIVNWSKPPA